MFTTAAFAALYAAAFVQPQSPPTDAVNNTEPPPRSRIAGTACFEPRNEPFTMTSNTASQSSSDCETTVPLRSMPALARNTSRPPNASTVAATIASLSAAFVTSAVIAVARPSGVADRGGDLLGVRAVDVGDAERCAFLGEAHRGGLADPGPRAGDQRDPPRQPPVGCHPFPPLSGRSARRQRTASASSAICSVRSTSSSVCASDR